MGTAFEVALSARESPLRWLERHFRNITNISREIIGGRILDYRAIIDNGTLKRELSEFIERSRLLKKQEEEPVKISNKVTSSDGIKCLINLFYSFHVLFPIIITF